MVSRKRRPAAPAGKVDLLKRVRGGAIAEAGAYAVLGAFETLVLLTDGDEEEGKDNIWPRGAFPPTYRPCMDAKSG